MKRKGAKVTPRKIETRFAVLRSLISVAAAMLLCLVLILLMKKVSTRFLLTKGEI